MLMIHFVLRPERGEKETPHVCCVQFICQSMEAWNRTEQQIVRFGWEKSALFERRTATDRMCTDTRCQPSLCNGGSWTQSNRSGSNIVISHTARYRAWEEHNVCQLLKNSHRNTVEQPHEGNRLSMFCWKMLLKSIKTSSEISESAR